MEYPKINSLWKRQGWYFSEDIKKNTPSELQCHRQSLIPGDFALPEFENIKLWEAEEKIDGTNIRVFYKNGEVRFGGRTKEAQIPCHLLDFLMKKFTPSLFQARFPDLGINSEVILFGEGFGAKIQSGGYYSLNPGFALFDVKVGHSWLEKDRIRYKLADELGVFVPPLLLTGVTLDEIVSFVKEKHFSRFAMNDPMHEHIMEGVMCRPLYPLLLRNGNPLMFKLKCKDFPCT